MIIEIVDYNKIPSKVVALVRFDKTVKITGDKPLVKALRDGVYNPKTKKMVKPVDGKAFMDALPFEFKSHIRANVLEE